MTILWLVKKIQESIHTI